MNEEELMVRIRYDGPGGQLKLGDQLVQRGLEALVDEETAARLERDRRLRITVIREDAQPGETPAGAETPREEQAVPTNEPEHREELIADARPSRDRSGAADPVRRTGRNRIPGDR